MILGKSKDKNEEGIQMTHHWDEAVRHHKILMIAHPKKIRTQLSGMNDLISL